jgi:hypothetical protein
MLHEILQFIYFEGKTLLGMVVVNPHLCWPLAQSQLPHFRIPYPT